MQIENFIDDNKENLTEDEQSYEPKNQVKLGLADLGLLFLADVKLDLLLEVIFVIFERYIGDLSVFDKLVIAFLNVPF